MKKILYILLAAAVLLSLGCGKREQIATNVERQNAAGFSLFDSKFASTTADENSRRYSLRVPAHFYEAFLYNIEHTGIQLRNLANQVDYATIDLYILGPVAAAVRQGDTFLI